jgi:hypothetical protein
VQEKLRSKLADSHLTLYLSVIHVARFQFSISRNKERTHLYIFMQRSVLTWKLTCVTNVKIISRLIKINQGPKNTRVADIQISVFKLTALSVFGSRRRYVFITAAAMATKRDLVALQRTRDPLTDPPNDSCCIRQV